MSATDFEVEIAQEYTIDYVKGINAGLINAYSYKLPEAGFTADVVIEMQERAIKDRLQQKKRDKLLELIEFDDGIQDLAFIMGATAASLKFLKEKKEGFNNE